MSIASDLTVVIPTYNRLPLLKRAIASVFAQTASPARIVVSVDGSTDGTIEWLQTLGERVAVIAAPNGGSASAMNRGIAAVETPIAVLLDDDDEWLPGYLDAVAAAWRAQPGAALVHAFCRPINGRTGEELPWEPSEPARGDHRMAMVLSCFVRTCSSVSFRTELFRRVGCFDESYGCLHDYDLYLRLLAHGPAVTIREPLVRYYLHDGGLTRSHSRWWAEQNKVLDRFFAQPESERYRRGEGIARNNLFRIVALHGAAARHPTPDLRADLTKHRAQAEEMLDRMVETLVRMVRATMRGRDYVLLDYPDYWNLGDHAIWIATRVLLEGMLGSRCLGAFRTEALDPETLRGLPPETVLVFKGGGNLGDLWPSQAEARARLIAAFPDRSIVLMPQSIEFRGPQAAADAARLFNAHPDLTVFVRDLRSYERGRSLFGESRMRLAPDTTLALKPLLGAVRRAIGEQGAMPALYLRRDDPEAEGARADVPEGLPAMDWPHRRALIDAYMPIAQGTMRDAGFDAIMEDKKTAGSWAATVVASAFLLRARAVVSDRLHGHILATMLGIPNVALPDAFGKVEAFLHCWSGSVPGTGFAPTLDEALASLGVSPQPEDAEGVRRGSVVASWGKPFPMVHPAPRRPQRDIPEIVVTPEPPRVSGGVLAVTARIDPPIGGQTQLLYRLPATVPIDDEAIGNAATLALLLPALRDARQLIVRGTVSRSLLDNLEEFQRAWTAILPQQLRRIAIVADREAASPSRSGPGIIAFSGGVDSTYSAWSMVAGDDRRRVKLETGVVVQGFDIPLARTDRFRRVFERAGRLLGALGLRALPLATNLRAVTIEYDWELTHGTAIASVLSLFGVSHARAVVSSSESYRYLGSYHLWGSNPLTDHLMGSDRLPILCHGSEFSRIEKAMALAGWPPAMRDLRVCWEDPETDGNCGRCVKCLLTRLALRMAGQETPSCFPPLPLTDEIIRGMEISSNERLESGAEILRVGRALGLADASWFKAFKDALDRPSILPY